ncbi:MAG: hypothetical protein ACM339_12920, partial [Ignavibacteria bacterium]
MKTIFSALLFLFTSVNAQQKYYTFSELRGMEDQSGNSHLFYRLFNSGPYLTSNSIYHLDVEKNYDTLFLEEELSITSFVDDIRIFYYDFWNNDPDKFIYTYITGSLAKKNLVKIQSPTTIIQRYDSELPNYSNISSIAR